MTDISQMTIRLATYNVRVPCDPFPNDWPSRQPRVISMLKRRGIVLAGLQEATKMQIDGILTDPAWDYVGVAREDGMELGEYSCIIYHKERFSVQDSGTFWLSETPDVPGSMSWNTAYRRICSWANFTDKLTGKPFMYFNTHLDHISREAQQNGMKVILDRMSRVKTDCPLILTGDFNVYPDDPVVALAESRLRNAYKVTETPKIGPEFTYHGYHTPGEGVEMPNTAPIDYIFVNNQFRILNLTVCDESENGLYSSDHYPVVAELL